MIGQMALGELPPLGEVPETMLAATIRPERYGSPEEAMALETVDVPAIPPGHVLVLVMAAGINYNNIWAGYGRPADVIAARRRHDPSAPAFHIGGSEGSGIVWRVGDGVRHVQPGDKVVLSVNQWEESNPDVRYGVDPTFSASQRAFGYETNFGTFAQFALAAEYQCHAMPDNLSWEEAASFIATGATAYRQLAGWPPHVVQPGDPVLVWGGAGGLGSMAIQIARAMGGRPVAVVSQADRTDFCLELGAVGVIDRRRFDHWGPVPEDEADRVAWLDGVRAFGGAFWDALGERESPRIVFEHPGRDTLPTSMFVCATGGMVVTCGATSGYLGDVDLRYLWMRQKRLQGSHCANLREVRAMIALMRSGDVRPCVGAVYEFADIARAHALMEVGEQPSGNNVVLVNAAHDGLVRG